MVSLWGLLGRVLIEVAQDLIQGGNFKGVRTASRNLTLLEKMKKRLENRASLTFIVHSSEWHQE